MRFPAAVARRIGFYVYTLTDPETKQVRYVGKGCGNRCFQHSKSSSNGKKAKWLNDLKRKGLKPIQHILIHGLETEEAALSVESAAIDLIGLDNEIRGWKSTTAGKLEIPKLIAKYQRRQIQITHSAILIRISKRFRYDMSPVELYDATRGIWRIGLEREQAQYAMAVFDGIIQEVYRIQAWFPAATTFSTRQLNENLQAKRWEFVGQIAPPEIRRRYLQKDVTEYFGATRAPFVYSWHR